MQYIIWHHKNLSQMNYVKMLTYDYDQMWSCQESTSFLLDLGWIRLLVLEVQNI